MSPAQIEEQLKKKYYLSLMRLRPTQEELFFKDYQVRDVDQNRMKLLIQTVQQQAKT